MGREAFTTWKPRSHNNKVLLQKSVEVINEYEAQGYRLTLRRPGSAELASHLQPGDTVVVVWQDRLTRNFEEGVALQADFIKRGIGIVSILENINTLDDSAPARIYRHTLLGQGDYLARSTGERIRVGQDRARAQGKHIGRQPAMTTEQVHEAR